MLVWHMNLPLARRFQRLRLRLQVKVRVSLLSIQSSNFRYYFILFVRLAVAIVQLVFIIYYNVSFSSNYLRALFLDKVNSGVTIVSNESPSNTSRGEFIRPYQLYLVVSYRVKYSQIYKIQLMSKLLLIQRFTIESFSRTTFL